MTASISKLLYSWLFLVHLNIIVRQRPSKFNSLHNVKKFLLCIISVLPLIKFPLTFCLFFLSSHVHSLYFKVSANSDNDRLHTLIGKIIIYYHGHVDDVIVQSRLELLQLFLSFYRTIKALIGNFP